VIPDRLHRLREGLEERELDAFLSLKLVNTYYLSGFTSLDTARPTTYTRPIAVVVDPSDSCLIVPLLDEEAAGETSQIRDIRCYSAAPAAQAARDMVLERLREVGARRVGIEQDTVTAEWAAFLERAGIELVFAGDLIHKLRMVKDESEIALLREASRLSETAIRASLDAGCAGVPEILAETSGVVALRNAAAADGDGAFVDAIPMVLAGPRSSMPHEFTTSRPIGDGDVMWHCWLVSYRGYWVENIRTAVAAPRSEQFERAHDVLHASLLAGQETARPGATAGDVYQAVMRVLYAGELPGVTILNRSGHGMGLEYHEPPFMEEGDATVLEPGMVITVEPGLFFVGTGGLAISNTLVIRDEAPEVLTTTPDQLHRAVA
jgi:Xaa-Pro aminopeptidase